MRYHVYLEGEPTLDSYRLSHQPRPDYGPVFICPYAVVTDGAGRMYNAMRGVMGITKGTTLNMGVYRLDGQLDRQCPILFPWSDAPVNESYSVVEDGQAVSFVGAEGGFRYDFGVDRYRWMDGGGRLQLTARRIGEVTAFWVPVQEGYEVPQLLRSHLGFAEGTIDGEPVAGLFMLDYIYSRPDVMWSEMGMLSKLHNVWMNWMVEYEDGELEGGFAWRGRPGTGFAAAGHWAEGHGRARSDAEITLHTTERGTPHTVDLRLGRDLDLTLSQVGSTDWPLHTCGTVSRISRPKPVARSWNYTEYFPLNWSAVADYQAAHATLFGRPPSFQRLMEGGRVVDQQLVYPDGAPFAGGRR